MKHLSLLLSLTSLSISAAIGVGAYITYQKAQKILDNPEEFVVSVVEKQVTKAFEKLPIPEIPKFKGRNSELNAIYGKFPDKFSR